MNAGQYSDVDKRIEVLGERMETMKAEMKANHAKYESALDRLRADMAIRDRDMAIRDRDNQRWLIGLAVGVGVLILGVAGLAVRLIFFA